MYPWASLGGFIFKREEHPIFPTDLGWIQNPQYTRQIPLGSTSDSIVTTAMGSMERTFDIYVSQERLAQLKSLVNTSFLFTDWDRPTPDSRQAFLASVTPSDIGFRAQPDSRGNHQTTRVKIQLLSL